MKMSKEHKLDELTRRIVNEVGKEQPSAALKLNIMQALNTQSKAIRYRALISNRAKVTVFILLIGIIGLSTFLSNDDLLTPVLGNFSQFVASLSVNLPNNFIYGIVVVGSLIIVQIPILKKRLDSN